MCVCADAGIVFLSNRQVGVYYSHTHTHTQPLNVKFVGVGVSAQSLRVTNVLPPLHPSLLHPSLKLVNKK